MSDSHLDQLPPKEAFQSPWVKEASIGAPNVLTYANTSPDDGVDMRTEHWRKQPDVY